MKKIIYLVITILVLSSCGNVKLNFGENKKDVVLEETSTGTKIDDSEMTDEQREKLVEIEETNRDFFIKEIGEYKEKLIKLNNFELLSSIKVQTQKEIIESLKSNYLALEQILKEGESLEFNEFNDMYTKRKNKIQRDTSQIESLYGKISSLNVGLEKGQFIYITKDGENPFKNGIENLDKTNLIRVSGFTLKNAEINVNFQTGLTKMEYKGRKMYLLNDNLLK